MHARTVRTALVTIAAALVAVALMSGSAVTAKTVTSPSLPSCNVTSIEGATACAGIFAGNDSNSDLGGLFGQQSWTEVLKLDKSAGTASGNGMNLFVSDGGTWSIDSYAGFAPVMFVTKGGNSFSAFLMDLKTLTGKWDTQSMVKGNGKRGPDLSHWTIYQSGVLPTQSPPPSAVPLPAGLWFLSAGIAGLALVRRKKA